MLNTCKRLFETPRLAWLRHVRCSHSFWWYGPCERNWSRLQDPSLTYAEIAFAHRRAPVVQGFDEGW